MKQLIDNITLNAKHLWKQKEYAFNAKTQGDIDTEQLYNLKIQRLRVEMKKDIAELLILVDK